MMPVVSVVLPTFNRLPYLRQAVDSVFAQTFKEWELIIADDGSDSRTSAYLLTLANLSRVKLLRLPHTGNPSAVRNAALREAQGRYVAFLDSDDVWLTRKLDIQLATHAASTACRWSYTAPTRIDASGQPMRDGVGLPWIPYNGPIFEQLLTFEAVIATPTVIAERRLLEQVGGFDEQQPFYEDYDLWLRLSLLSDVVAINEPLTLVRTHSKHYSADRVRVYESRFRLLEKMSHHAATGRLQSTLGMERAKNAASLAMAYAIAGRRAEALRMLWRSRECSRHQPKWWRNARLILVQAIAPTWLREVVRRIRRLGRTLATEQN
jgi:glycosyltransferase involved in cell wall biosynthesis